MSCKFRVTRRPLLPGHVLFSRPKKCVRQGFQKRPGFCLVGYLCFCLSQTSYFRMTSFGKAISLTFHLLARALTVERTVIGRPPSQCCQIGKLSSKCNHFVPLILHHFQSGNTEHRAMSTSS